MRAAVRARTARRLRGPAPDRRRSARRRGGRYNAGGGHGRARPLKEAEVVDTPGYPVTLRMTGRRVLVVGGGAVATRRLSALLEAGALVDVVAPDASPDVREAA